MRRALWAVIFITLAAVCQAGARAASVPSDWPQLNSDAAQTNNNRTEKGLTAATFLKLRVRWSAAMPDVSYPIVAAGRVYLPVSAHGKVHVRALDAATGKQVASFPKDALGGLLYTNGLLYLAGHVVQSVDPGTGQKQAQIGASPDTASGVFIDPLADSKMILAGYTAARPAISNALYAIDPQTTQVRWKAASLTAAGTIGSGRIMTEISSGSAFYDEASGKSLARANKVYGDWFAGSMLNYTVATIGRGNATLYAYDGTGHQVWKRVVGPHVVTTGWPHAVTNTSVYVQTLKPQVGLEALDPESGSVLWFRPLSNIQRVAVANGVVYGLTDFLGQPARLIGLHTKSGAVIGAHVLSAGYYTFSSYNELMVAAGMIFIRVVGPKGSQLVALGP